MDSLIKLFEAKNVKQRALDQKKLIKHVKSGISAQWRAKMKNQIDDFIDRHHEYHDDYDREKSTRKEIEIFDVAISQYDDYVKAEDVMLRLQEILNLSSSDPLTRYIRIEDIVVVKDKRTGRLDHNFSLYKVKIALTSKRKYQAIKSMIINAML